jgi:hypothetical protein
LFFDNSDSFRCFPPESAVIATRSANASRISFAQACNWRISGRITYPVAVDSNLAIWQAFNNEYWPAHYFIDRRSRIRYHHFGEGEYDQSERVIQMLLAEAGSRDGAVPQGIVEKGWRRGGEGTLTEHRLYQLVRQTGPILDRIFEIEIPEFPRPGVRIYVRLIIAYGIDEARPGSRSEAIVDRWLTAGS